MTLSIPPPPPPRRIKGGRLPEIHLLTAALLAALLAPGLSLAQQSSNEEDATEIDRVSVVGSRIKRAQVEGPAPVIVITREQINREGFQTVGDALQTLSQNTASSFTGDLAVTGFTPNAQVVNLRNLGPGYTLTLINGRRPAQYPYPYNRDNNVTNVRAIPSSIVERIEVLSGGASAIYGSDAVAGVVNIVLRDQYDGNAVRLVTGTTTHGGGDYASLELTGGRSGDRWSALWAFQYNNQDQVFASQRNFLSDLRNGPLGNQANPSLSLIAISGAGLTAPADQNALFPGEAACAALGMVAWNTAIRGDYCGSFNQVASRSISNASEFHSAYGYATFDVTETTQLWGSLNYYSVNAKSSAGTEFWGTAGDPFTTRTTGGPTALYYDDNLNDLIRLQRIFLPQELGGNEAASSRYDEYTYDLAAGIRGSFSERFDWEANVSHGKYRYEMNRPRLLAKAVHDYFLGNQLGEIAGYRVFALNQERWNRPITPEIYRTFATTVVNESDTTANTANFIVNGDLFELPAGTVGIAGLLEWNQQKIDMRSDPRIDPLRPLDEQTVFNLVGSGQTNGSRDRYAFGVEFSVPIFSQLHAQLAGRRDKYDDLSNVDAANTFNLGLEWRPASNFLVRGSIASSFRAPDMQLVYAEGAASFSNILDEYACRSGTGRGAQDGPRTRAQCNTAGDRTIYQTQTIVAGNPNLREEKGKSWVGGVVWDLTDGLSLSMDWYRIKLAGAAAQLGNSVLLRREADCRLGRSADGGPPPSQAVCDEVYSLITRIDSPGTVEDGQITRISNAYINTAKRDITGLDTNVRYRRDTNRIGSFEVNLAHSLVMTNRYQRQPEDDLVDYRDQPPIVFYPERSRMRGSLTWRYEDWTTTLFGTRYGSAWSYAEEDGVNAAGRGYPRRLKPYFLYNMSVGRKIGPSVEVMAQVVNVFDRQYRKDNSETNYPFYNPYIGADPLGRRFYLSMQYKF